MPSFEVVSIEEAKYQSATGKRAERLREYAEYLKQVRPGAAGKLSPAEGETATAVRRRLTQAAKMNGQEVTVKRVGQDLYFWTEARQPTGQRRRGRPRKNPL